ncbi:MAG: PEGA domain-containing protein [Akkermansia sp.]|nr:PEGA domain-containing protein [Akkermansia sp.]MBR1979540.1 PEGA domain-containing protein [Akkermansia sp.]
MKCCLHLFAALFVLCLVSCYGTKEFTIYTQPEGANVTINGKPIEGKTPITTTIEQDKDLGIVVDKPGYRIASKTVYTQSNWWLRLLWSDNDPRSQFIEEEEVFIPMEKISSAASFVPSSLPEYTGGAAAAKRETRTAPPLRPMPEF